MSVFMNSLTQNQVLLIENLSGNYKYGKAELHKGEIRALRKAGIIKGRSLALTANAPVICRERSTPVCMGKKYLDSLKEIGIDYEKTRSSDSIC